MGAASGSRFVPGHRRNVSDTSAPFALPGRPSAFRFESFQVPPKSQTRLGITLLLDCNRSLLRRTTMPCLSESYPPDAVEWLALGGFPFAIPNSQFPITTSMWTRSKSTLTVFDS